MVAFPLYEHDADAAGDAAYVMADGHAYWERLRAASDLYHMKRVPRIIILDEKWRSGYNFVERRSMTRLERAMDYLELYGVPRDRVSTICVQEPATFGSLSEARAVAREDGELKRLVVVTSGPHTRRSGLAFRRCFDSDVQIQVFSATAPQHSAEIHSPLWKEYVKLIAYCVVA